MKEKGRVYIVTNPAFPHLFKIGMTGKDSTEKRGLTSSNVPEDFVTVREYECDDPRKIEDLIHRTYDVYRHHAAATGRRTEFFYITCFNEVLEWMDTLKGLTDVTAKARAEEETIEDATNDLGYDETKVIRSNIRSRTTFALVDIPIGSILTLDIDEKATVKTIDNKNTVELSNGERMPMSTAANKLMQERGRKWRGVSGSWHLIFEGETLWERRLRMEKEGLI